MMNDMGKDEKIKYLQEKYPEDLNSDYKCYWWYTQSIDKDSNPIGNPTYYLILKDKQMATEEKGLPLVLKKGSESIEYLEKLLLIYLQED